MAYQAAHASMFLGGLSRIGHRLRAAFAVAADAFAYASRVNHRLYLVEQLEAKSDDELAQLGIKRDAILRHVFLDQDNR